MRTSELKILLWLFVGIFATLSALGLAAREPLQAAYLPPGIETPLTPPRSEPAPAPRLTGRTSGPKCPLGRVAMVRGSDSEASEGGGFYAARTHGIHGAVDLNGSLGESVFAVADGRVVVAARSDWGKLGKTVILDHQDGAYTVYGHLHTVEVEPNSRVTAGHMIGTIGYSGNAAGLQAKNLPPHLHFAYLQAVAGINERAAPLARVKNSADGFRPYSANDTVVGDGAAILNPIRAVKYLKCWEDAPAAVVPSTRSTRTMPR